MPLRIAICCCNYLFGESLKKLLENENDIHIISMGQGKLRMVTHLDYTDPMHQVLLKKLKSL